MLLLVAAISLHLNFASHANNAKSEPVATCGIHVVSYRFVGEPGVEFRYRGRDYTVPKGGTVEVIAGASDKTYRANGRELRLDVFGERDEFGAVTVPLPTKAAAAALHETVEIAEAR